MKHYYIYLNGWSSFIQLDPYLPLSRDKDREQVLGTIYLHQREINTRTTS